MRTDQIPVSPLTLPRYPPHSLAPDPRQPELELRPQKILCTRCGSVHQVPACPR